MKTLNKFSLLFPIIANISLTALASGESGQASDFIPAKIVTAINHTCILSKRGQVKCWGANYDGELGNTGSYGHAPETMGAHLPLVNFGTDLYAKDLCGGSRSTCVATTDGRVKCWGNNTYGQLGQERDVTNVGGQANDMGDNLPFTSLGSDFKVKSIHCGEYSTCAVSDAGKLKCWGLGNSGQLGANIAPKASIGSGKDEMGDKLPFVALPVAVEHVSLGYSHTCVASKSEIYCWGSNSDGKAGIGSSESLIYLPTDPTKAMKVKLEDDGVATVIEGLTSGTGHNCALYHLASRPTDQKLKCWGANSSGALGIGSLAGNMGRIPETIGAKLPTVSLALDQLIQIEGHQGFSCALAKNGFIKCWGTNSNGSLGAGDTTSRGSSAGDMGRQLPLVDLGLPAIALASGARSESSCAILINHEIKCWGGGYYGALGYEDIENRGAKKDDMGENLPFVRYK